MRIFINWLYLMHQKVLTFLIAILIIPVAMQILARFTEIVPNYIWTEEMSRFCLIWIIMIGASIAVRDGTHFDVDILRSSESIIGQVIGRCIVYLSIFLVALIFIAFGWSFAKFGYDQNSELTGMNMVFIHIAWPIAGFTWVLFILEKFYDDIKLISKSKEISNGAV